MIQPKKIDPGSQRSRENRASCAVCIREAGGACENAGEPSPPDSPDRTVTRLEWPRGWYAWSSLVKEGTCERLRA